jgi:hypothetical protein
MKSSTVLRFAGDVSIDKVKIITPTGFYQDITAQVINVQFYEDIFSPFLSGSLIIKESFDLINLFPFIGEEYVELEVTTPTLSNFSIKGKYYIYKLTNREMIGERSVAYQLHFISLESISDLNKKNSRVFADKVSNLVEPFILDDTIGMESDKKFFIEETSNNIKYISNFWSPVKNIMYLTEHALNKNNSPSYVFFENRDGFYFISLESLYSNPVVYQEFVYDSYTRDDLPNGKSARNITEDYKRILEISIPVGFDYIDRIQSGMLSSKLTTFDPIKKTYSSRNYTMFQKFEQQKHLNPYPINSNKSIFRANSRLFNQSKMYGNFNGFGDVTNSRFTQERVSLMKLAESNKLNITVPGRVDYTVGQKIKVTLNRFEPISKRESDIQDKMFSGYYVIAAINHYVDREKHECLMEVIKESSLMDMNKGSK